MTDTILVIDDEQAIRRAIVRAFPDQHVVEAETIAAGIDRLREDYPDLVILDQRLPDGNGIEAVGQMVAIDPELPILLLTGHGSVDMAVDALKQGIADFVEKPFKLERLRHSVEMLLEKQRLGRQVARLSGRSAGRTQVVARSGAMKRVLQLVRRVAAVPSTTVLIQGESGVGKELVAQAIHYNS
ncbi:MAG: sigma-54-dependent transcriptional regulator, partial [Planctomycetota bacterium]